MIPIIDYTYYKLGGTVIGFLTSYSLYENVYNRWLYNYNIHKNIGKIIAEYQIDNTNDKLCSPIKKINDRSYIPIKTFNGKSWIIDPTNIKIEEGITKLQTKYPNNKCNENRFISVS